MSPSVFLRLLLLGQHHPKSDSEKRDGGLYRLMRLSLLRARLHPKFKLLPIVALVIFFLNALMMEATFIFVHIACYLVVLSAITISLYKLVNYYTPQKVSKGLSFLLILVTSAAVRHSVESPGLTKLFLGTICLSVVLLLIYHFIPLPVLGIMFVSAWLVLTYRWLLWEFCRIYSYHFDNRCSIGWASQAVVVFVIYMVWCANKYRAQMFNFIVQACIVFPYLFGFLFLCSWWCLVSPSTFWMRDAPHTKAEVMKYVPANYSLGHDVIRTDADLELIPESRYPVFFKPNECSGEARGITPIDNILQAKEYLRIRNSERPERSTLMQTLHTTGAEATIIYYRFPYFAKGGIKTVWLKVFHLRYTHAINSLRSRVLAVSPGPDHWEFYTRNHAHTPIRDDIAQSPKLLEVLESIVKGIPGMTVCRFDVKYETVEELKEGIFKVIELDLPPFGDRREKADSSDESLLYSNFVLAAKQARTLTLWFYIGFINILWGNTLGPLDSVAQVPKLVTIANLCQYRGSMSPVTPGIQ